jgi:hypothetical protein
MDCYCDYFFSKIKKSKGCWLWTGNKIGSHKIEYGYMNNGTKSGILAHRYSYIIHKGTIIKGLVIDHLCRNGLCVNPKHLELVTNKENILRGIGAPALNARKKYCKKGHLLKGKNIRLRGTNRRICITCEKEYNKNRKYKR